MIGLGAADLHARRRPRWKRDQGMTAGPHFQAVTIRPHGHLHCGGWHVISVEPRTSGDAGGSAATTQTPESKGGRKDVSATYEPTPPPTMERQIG